MADTDFDPWGFDEDDEELEPDGDEDITDLEQLWQYADSDYYDDFVEYEFHGTGDTGKRD